ncbi:MAG: trypsin-like peptidase domain-containing protein [Phycisphaerales bacterium]
MIRCIRRLVLAAAVLAIGSSAVVTVADTPVASTAPPPAATTDFRSIVRAARAKVFPAVVYLKCLRQSLESGRSRTEDVGGSGVVISEQGELLTNWHVVDRAVEIRALLSDGRAFKADLVASDRDIDLALVQLRIETKNAPIPTANLGTSSSLEEGDFVMAMGAPWGLNRSVSVGIVACTRRYLPESSEYSLWIQTDASISPGNSGGPLVDTEGNVVGITTLGRMAGGDMGFAIPSDTIREVLPRMRELKQVGWSWSGLLLQPLRDFDKDTYFEGVDGVIVAGVEPGSPAEKAGLKSRDRLLAVAGAPTNGLTSEDLPNIRRRIALLPAGKPVELTIVRVGQQQSITLTPADKGRVQGDELECPRWGLTVKQINRFENAELHRVRPEGVFVFGVRTPGNAAAAGLAENDILIEVDGKPIATLDDLHRAYDASLESMATKKRLLVKLLRAGQLRQVILDISRDYERE